MCIILASVLFALMTVLFTILASDDVGEKHDNDFVGYLPGHPDYKDKTDI